MTKKMNEIPSRDRLLSIDLARGLAVFFMIAVHTLEVFASPEVQQSLFGEVIEFLGGPAAAPVFMTLMGFSFIYSRPSTLQTRVRRGLGIFLSGYVLNFLRGVLPFMLSKYFEMDIAETFPSDKLNGYTLFTLVDILQFAGIALVIMALIQEFKINKFVVLGAAVLVSLLSPVLWGWKANLPVLDQIFELLWGDQPIQFSFIENKIAFPVFPWLSFPLLGMFLGETMMNSTDQKRTFTYFGIAGFLASLIGVAISYADVDYHFNDYYHSRQGAMVFMGGFVIFWLYLNQLMVEKVPMNKLFKLLFTWSKGVTVIYFAQWILICWSIAFFGINQSGLITTTLLIFTFTILSHYANEWFGNDQPKPKRMDERNG
jgi:uncharacterized membrane protein